jgi:hypothetical protein
VRMIQRNILNLFKLGHANRIPHFADRTALFIQSHRFLISASIGAQKAILCKYSILTSRSAAAAFFAPELDSARFNEDFLFVDIVFAPRRPTCYSQTKICFEPPSLGHVCDGLRWPADAL